MKRIITTLLLIGTILTSYSQTPLDYKVFEKINEYRVENGIHELTWCDTTYQAAKHHTDYMIKNKIIRHHEDNETPKFTYRLRLYLQHGINTGDENLAWVPLNDIEDSTDKIANSIVNVWKDSKGHNSTMLTKGNDIGAVSCGNGVIIDEVDEWNGKYSTLLVWSRW